MKDITEYSLQEKRLFLIQYLEGTLSEQEEISAEELLKSSEEASHELEGLTKMIHIVRGNERVFCPQPWDIARALENDEDSAGEIILHIHDCEMCKKEALALREGPASEAIPARLWSSIKAEFPESSREQSPRNARSLGTDWLKPLSFLFGIRPLLVGAATAAALIALVIIPIRSVGPVIGLSSVTWNGPLGNAAGSIGSAYPGDKERLAIILFFEGFKEPLSQQRIDALYQAIKPDKEQEYGYEILTPAQLKAYLSGKRVNSAKAAKVYPRLVKDLGVQKVLQVVLEPQGADIKIKSRLLNAPTGEPVRDKTEYAIPRERLDSELRQAVYGLLEPETRKFW
ncbi:hypothetical protein ACFL2Q_02660 [Thermodesulfobacteriota bacterium]